MQEIKNLLERERTAKQICAELNGFVDLKNTLISIIEHIKELTGIEAVSIRLHDKGDYPYYVYNGFPESFIRKENSLCAKDRNGNMIMDENGNNYLLECMCGNIIKGRFDASLDFFSKKGSFWSNHTTHLLATTTDSDRQAHTRNFCNSCGYESVALIPIKNKNGIIGLVQLNDKRIGRFTIELIEYMEMIAEQIGLAVENAMIYDNLAEKKNQLEDALSELKRSQNQLLEAKKMAGLGQLVAGISHEMNTPIGNALMGVHNIMVQFESFSMDIEKSNSLNDELKDFLQSNLSLIQIVLRNIKRSSELLNSFKNISLAQESGKKERFFINKFIEDIFQSISPTLNNKEITFNFQHKDDIIIYSYGNYFFQIFSNLIMNSYIHGFENKDEGTITINCIKDGDYFEIQYSDNGIGMPPEVQIKVFEPFFTTKKSTCTGVGMSMVYNTVSNQLNGTVSLKSNPGEGVLFIIRIPVNVLQ